MAKKLIFKNAEAVRDAIMDSQKKEIANLYESWADEIGERAKFYSHKSTASAPVSERYYKELKKQLRATSQQVSNEVYSKIKSNMYTISDAVVADNVEWLKSFGFNEKGLNAAFSYVPDSVVRNLITGQVYDSGWSLSKRIWSDNEMALKDIYGVMAKGVAMNKPIYEIAKDLEAYVRPSARLPWNLTAKDGVRIYKKQVDYNAQRLARTLAQHSYQQSFIATTQNNPFISEYIWISNGSRVCDLCKARDGMHFKKNELPMDHPNGMCIMEPVVAEDMVDQLTDWFNSPDGTYPEIDAFASNFGYEASKISVPKHNFVNGKDMSAIWERREEDFDFVISDIVNAQGFDGLPQIVGEEEFNEAVQQSGLLMKRGYRARSQEALEQYQKEFYQGKWYLDCSGGSAYGHGMYSGYAKAGDDIGLEILDDIANRYGKGGIVETFTVAKDAKLIKYEDLIESWDKFRDDWGAHRFHESAAKKVYVENTARKAVQDLNLSKEQSDYLLDRYFDISSDTDTVGWYRGLSRDEQQEIDSLARKKLRPISEKIDATVDSKSRIDEGEYAALLGYDGILIEKENYAVILNRSKLIIKKG